MKWQGRRTSRNVEDRRGTPGPGPRLAGPGGLGAGAVLLLLVLGWVLGVDVTPLLQGGGTVVEAPGPARPGPGPAPGRGEDAAGTFAAVVLADTEEVWTRIFREELGRDYPPPVLVLFAGRTASPCGGADGASGPFYCPADQKAYLDTDFFAVLERQLGAKGDFAAAYVIAHEVGHHVQRVLGILERANALRARVSEAESNRISVMIELQADCLAGVWARAARDRLGTVEPGDLDEALDAAKRIGDDILQRRAGRTPMPHTFTHGTAEQRRRWFARGLESGRIGACDTFSAREL